MGLIRATNTMKTAPFPHLALGAKNAGQILAIILRQMSGADESLRNWSNRFPARLVGQGNQRINIDVGFHKLT